MRITRVYTRNGDKGTTRLADGTEVPKNSLRLCSYGCIDELNAILGVCCQFLQELPEEEQKLLGKWLEALQNDLFNLGADLATPIKSRWENMVLMEEKDIEILENMIDRLQRDLEPLKDFVLPGGTKLNAFLHCARTVCRRAETLAVELQNKEEINPQAVPYLNRLSDLFFVISRWVQVKSKKEEITWERQKGVRYLNI